MQPSIQPKDRIIVVLDHPTLGEAQAMAVRLAGQVGMFKAEQVAAVAASGGHDAAS